LTIKSSVFLCNTKEIAMPILFQISIEVNSGSIGRIAEHIGSVAMQHGWDSYITYARNYLPSKSKTIKIGSKWDIYWHGINTRLFDNHCLKSTNATKKLIRQIQEIKPDIILMHHIHGYFLNMRILFSYLSKINIPVLWVFHDCWSITGHCAYFDYAGCAKWLDGCYKCPQKNTYPASIFFDCSKRNYQLKKELFTSVANMTIIPVSKWLGEIIGRSFLNKYPIQVIPNGIDIDIFSPQPKLNNIRKKFKLENKFVILGVASTWEPRKGLNDFVKLNEIIDHNSYKIILVGLTKKQIRCLPKEIWGIERTESVQELAELYSVADLHISFSVEETFGLTIIESMSCGTPVVVYNCTALPELITDKTGLVVETGNLNDAYEKIQIIKRKGKQFYSQHCRQRAVLHYDKRERFKDYINLFHQLLRQ
jgi:glycosyltransferase involved in cell wall biosynthesis